MKKCIKKRLISSVTINLLIFSLLFLPLMSSSSLGADKAIELKYASFFPAGHPFSVGDSRAMDKIEKEANGQIHFEKYFAGTLVRGPNPVEIQAGVADIGVAVVTVVPRGFDILKHLLQALTGVDSREEMRKINAEFYKMHPELLKDWEIYGKPIAVNYPPLLYLGLQKPITTFDDVKGLKIRATRSQQIAFNRMGAEGIDMQSSELYLALQKGTIDGAILGNDMLKSMKIAEVVKYMYPLYLFDPVGLWRIMNKNSYNKLPGDVQKVITDNGDYWGLQCDNEADKTDNDSVEFAKSIGVTFGQLPPDEIAKFHKIMESVIYEKMAEADAKGLPGTQVYKDLVALAKKY